MDTFRYAVKEEKDITEELGTDTGRGLSRADADARLEEYGPNAISSGPTSWLFVLGRQFKSVFIYLLFAASAITYMLGEVIDGSMILLFLLLNALLGFYQEYRSERTVELLKRYVVSYVKAFRDGEVSRLQADRLVPGDIIILETGNKIPADVRFIEVDGVLVDESVLTGESVPVSKEAVTLEGAVHAYHEARNLGFSGTTMLAGWARAVVVATGARSSVGRISSLVSETRRVSNFEKNISQFSNFILRLIAVTIAVLFCANILLKKDGVGTADLLIFSIALTVSVIPEALPVVMTFSLSRGARRLAKQGVVVKRLSAVEDLGGIEILCSDKTGTLTENKLEVKHVYTVSSEERVLWYANLAGEFDEKTKIEPFDNALWHRLPAEAQRTMHGYVQEEELPFDPRTRKNAVLVRKEGLREVVVRGAPEAVFALCAGLSDGMVEHMREWIKEEGRAGRRVLGVASKTCEEGIHVELDKEADLRFEGIVSFVDPIKPSAYAAVRQAEKLGIMIKIVTGDGREVAGAVGHEIGLASSPEEVLTAEEWRSFDAEERLAALRKYNVIARVSPEEKYEIIGALQSTYVVGFLGEGINDAPALKAAGVSLVVESGADIAREAADIILLKKNLKVVLDGIEEGRKVFANTTKYIKATLTSNFGNFFAVAAASLVVDFLPMLPLQILLVNLLSDFPMIAISADSVDSRELASPKKYDVRDIVIFSLVLGAVSTFFDFMLFGLFYRMSPEVLQTNWFIGSILTELALLFSIRSRKFFLKARRPSGVLVYLTSLAAFATVVLPFMSWGEDIFGFVRPSASHLVLIFSIVGIYFICTETLKLIFYKRLSPERS